MCALARDGVEGYGRRQHSSRGQVKMQPPTRITSEGGAALAGGWSFQGCFTQHSVLTSLENSRKWQP